MFNCLTAFGRAKFGQPLIIACVSHGYDKYKSEKHEYFLQHRSGQLHHWNGISFECKWNGADAQCACTASTEAMKRSEAIVADELSVCDCIGDAESERKVKWLYFNWVYSVRKFWKYNMLIFMWIFLCVLLPEIDRFFFKFNNMAI